MIRRKPKDAKEASLQKQGTLNRKPETVTDPIFDTDQFFDRRDLLQVKYEMLRRVRVEGESITHSAKSFGFSRPAFYDAQTAFEAKGLAGLVPKKRGPHGPHKLTDEVMDFVEETRQAEETITSKELIERIKKRFGLDVNPRSLDKVTQSREKKQP